MQEKGEYLDKNRVKGKVGGHHTARDGGGVRGGANVSHHTDNSLVIAH